MQTITLRSRACTVALVDLSTEELEHFAAVPDADKRGELLQDIRAEVARRAGVRGTSRKRLSDIAFV